MAKKDDFKQLMKAAKEGDANAEQLPQSKRTSPDYVKVGFHLPKKLHKRLKVIAADLEKEMSDCAAEAIEDWLKKQSQSGT
ncbi:MAG: CopG family transcriptional regulator [Symploca sp. SIO1B1]|nr:CopG family transcriptional regulator [Symploca sp. SIO2D2]NER93399.1 CopG family transcriptional regulator [Symploca sp. SIO1B1]